MKPFTGLSPELVLDAAASVGLEVDGRLFALNSYENRVYQLGSPQGSLVLNNDWKKRMYEREKKAMMAIEAMINKLLNDPKSLNTNLPERCK